MSGFLVLRSVSKAYSLGDETIYALRNVSLTVQKGEYLALLGPSGSGKSTLMNIMGCLDQPTSGEYVLAGRRVDLLDDRELALLRSRSIGFVFQSFNLIPRLSALANVERALVYQGVPRPLRLGRSRDALARVGLSDRMHHLPSELSGGQRQRVAIARALCSEPELLIADEPTGNLDTASASQVMTLFDELNGEGATIVLVTHDDAIADRCHRAVVLRDGSMSECEDGRFQG